MKIVHLAVIIFFMTIPSRSYAHAEHSAKKGVFTKHFNESLFKISEKGLFSIEILMDEKEYKIGKDVIGLIVHDNHDDDVEGAAIAIAVLPAQESAAIKSPVVKEKGEGLYTVANLNLQRADNWELKIKVKKKKAEDFVIFNFPDVMAIMPAGKYDFGNKK